MNDTALKPESQRMSDSFHFVLGSEIIAREKDGTVEIGDFDFDLLERFFRAGWEWGKLSQRTDND